MAEAGDPADGVAVVYAILVLGGGLFALIALDKFARSPSGYWVGGGLFVAGVVGTGLWLLSALGGVGNDIGQFQRVPIPGKAAIQLQPRKYVIYHERWASDERVPPFAVNVTDVRTGKRLTIRPYEDSLFYSFYGREGSAMATVRPAYAGAYTVRTSSLGRKPLPGESVALGRSFASSIGHAFLIGVSGFALAGLGVLFVWVTTIRRYRARRALARLASAETEREPSFTEPEPPQWEGLKLLGVRPRRSEGSS